jgi:hypothetical protein
MWDLLDKIGILLGVLLGLLSLVTTSYSAWCWLKYRRLERMGRDVIVIRLVSVHDPAIVLHEIPYRPLRKSICRAELLGYLGMIPSGQQRFDLAFLHDPAFFVLLQRVQDGHADLMEIPVTEAEWRQFDLSVVGS